MTIPSSAGAPCVVRDARDGKLYSAVLEQVAGGVYWVRAFNGSGNPFELSVDATRIWTIGSRPADPIGWYEPRFGGYSGGHQVPKVTLNVGGNASGLDWGD